MYTSLQIAKEYDTKFNTFFVSPNEHAYTVRSLNHDKATIVVNRAFASADYPLLFLQEILLHELAHVVTCAACSVAHRTDGTAARCTPQKLSNGLKGCKHEAGYAFEEVSRGFCIDWDGLQLVANMPCGKPAKQRAIVDQNASTADLEQLHFKILVTPKSTKNKSKTGKGSGSSSFKARLGSVGWVNPKAIPIMFNPKK
jgi:hypothetical protein